MQATVVRAQKPTSAHAGDTALVRADGSIDGFVGGTCAEASVREYGLMTLSTNEPLLLRIVPGEVRRRERRGGRGHRRQPVPVRRRGGDLPRAAGARAAAARGRGQPRRRGARRARRGRSGSTSTWSAGDQAEPVAGDAALVVASHGRGEEPALTAALRLGVPYVGLVASRIRGAAVLGRPSTSPTSSAAGCTARPGWTSAAGRRPRSRCRSSPRLVAERRAAERHAPAPVPATARRPGVRHDGRRRRQLPARRPSTGRRRGSAAPAAGPPSSRTRPGMPPTA